MTRGAEVRAASAGHSGATAGAGQDAEMAAPETRGQGIPPAATATPETALASATLLSALHAPALHAQAHSSQTGAGGSAQRDSPPPETTAHAPPQRTVRTPDKRTAERWKIERDIEAGAIALRIPGGAETVAKGTLHWEWVVRDTVTEQGRGTGLETLTADHLLAFLNVLGLQKPKSTAARTNKLHTWYTQRPMCVNHGFCMYSKTTPCPCLSCLRPDTATTEDDVKSVLRQETGLKQGQVVLPQCRYPSKDKDLHDTDAPPPSPPPT